MSDIVYCNNTQTKKILKRYFSIQPIITKVSKNESNGMYYLQGITIPGLHFTQWQYRPWNNAITHRPIKACFGSVEKGERRYDLGSCDEDFSELLKPLNNACKQAIERYERGCDIFQSEGMQITKGFFKNIWYNITKSSKRGYIWTIIILFILLLLSLTSCVGSDSIQNYVGAEVIQIEKVIDTLNGNFYKVKLRTKDMGTKHSAYSIISVSCYDAQGYQVGDTIKLNKFPK